MKEVNLISISLENFRGHKDLKIALEKETVISGRNKAGKSTVFDSFVWMLFGKDQFDRKDYEIIPIIDGKKLDRVDTSVTAIINIDLRETKLQRVLHQKWVRKRGKSEEVFEGCETLYYINDVPKKAGEYRAFVETIADESVFKMITNPSAFLALHWVKQREFLFQVVGTVSDSEIAKSNPIFHALLNMLNGKSLSDFKKELSSVKKKLKSDLEDIQPRIDQTSKLMPAEKEFEKLESELITTDNLIKEIDLNIADKAAEIRGQYDSIQASQKQINDLKTRQTEIHNVAKAKAVQDSFDENQKRRDIDAQMKSAHSDLQNEQFNFGEVTLKIQGLKASLEAKSEQVTKLRSEWSRISSSEIKFSDSEFSCPTCKRELETMDLDSKKTFLTENFKNDKSYRLAEINVKGIALKAESIIISDRILIDEKEASDYLLLVENSKETIKNLIEKLSKHDTINPIHIAASDIPEWSDIEAQVKAIEAGVVEVKPVDNSEANAKKAELTSRRDTIKGELLEKGLIERYKSEIKSLEKKGSELAQQIADAEKQEFTIDDFNRIKIEECERRINGLFEIVKFQLFDKTNDGNEFETCIPTNKKGVTIAATNTAERINAGIDIINTLSGFYKVSAPIFIDSAESVNSFISTKAQTIHLVVTEEQALTIK